MRTKLPRVKVMVSPAKVKEVLVGLGERKRAVSFQSSSDPSKEKDNLLASTKIVFEDILKDEDQDNLIINMKSGMENLYKAT